MHNVTATQTVESIKKDKPDLKGTSFRLYLGGFMAAGKTSVGSKLSELTGLPFLDTDDLIEAMAGMSIAEIFATCGEGHFRELERRVLDETFKLKNVIVGLGGGVLVNPENKAKIMANGTLIMLDAAVNTIIKRASNQPGKRPLLREDNVAELLNKRRDAYKDAHFRVSTDEILVDEVASLIVQGLGLDVAKDMPKTRCETLQVRTKGTSYPVIVGRGILTSDKALNDTLEAFLGIHSGKPFIISDPITFTMFARKIKEASGFHLLPRGEEGKTLRQVSAIYEKLSQCGVDRKGLILAVGGGCVGDAAGFAASTWMRGIDIVHIPTTLIAQVDSSIGGKTAVNLPEGKNLVGTFHQPCCVIVDVNCLLSLPDEEFRQGMAEVIKYGLGEDREFFRWLSDNRRSILERDPDTLLEMVKRCIELKASIVKEDEKETSGARTRLNLGHTVAHGLEASSGYSEIKHGDAVAIGLVVAARMAVMLNLCRDETLAELLELLEFFGLPVRPDRPFDEVVAYLMKDKKFVGGRPTMVLPTEGGKCKVLQTSLELLGDAYRATTC